MIKFKQENYSWPAWRIVIMTLNILAIVLSLILSWHYFKEGEMPGCGSGSSCDQVLSSRWSSLAGFIPISGLALGAYISLLVVSLNINTTIELSMRRLSWSILTVLAGLIIGSAIWFTILQKWIIGSFCVYCMTIHITGFLLSVIIIWRATKEYQTIKKDFLLIKSIRIIGLIIIGLMLAGIVAIIQFKYTPSAVTKANDKATIYSDMDYNDAPFIGSPDAPYKVKLLFDYQCGHCQKIHFMLNSVVRQYNEELAFILCPTPLENNCNPYVPTNKTTFKNSCELAKIGLAIWRTKPEVFSTFENWMFTFDTGNLWQPRSIDLVRLKAEQLIGQEELNIALADPWIEQYLQKSIQLFGQTLQNGKGAIPKMIFNNAWLIPEPYNADDLMIILQKSLGVPKPSIKQNLLINKK